MNHEKHHCHHWGIKWFRRLSRTRFGTGRSHRLRSEEHTSELQSLTNLVCRLLLEKKKDSTARPSSIMENTNLSTQQQVSEIMRKMRTQAQTPGQYFTNDKIKEMTRKVSADVDLVHQQTQNQRYGSSHIGASVFFFNNPPPPESSVLPQPVLLPI